MSRLAKIRPIDSAPETPGSTIRIGSKLSGEGAIADPRPVKKDSKADSSTVVNIPSGSSSSRPKKPKQVLPQAQKFPYRNNKTSTQRLLDAIYFICPDCSILQCSTIILGLVVCIGLTLLFMYLGGYWETIRKGQ